jgi:hypothetical protein
MYIFESSLYLKFKTAISAKEWYEPSGRSDLVALLREGALQRARQQLILPLPNSY